MTLKKYKPYLISISIPLFIGAISSVFTIKGMPYYEMQKKPFFTPPEILFPVVWFILYILMGISAARVKKSTDPKNNTALLLYYLQLLFNFLWTVLFFGMHQYLAAFFCLLILIALLIKMIQSFASIDTKAAKLQIPYLLWCIFAALLNFCIWQLNR